ncbi:unnamed protein product [Brassicogethes aeneus]|uniref:Uncharacterized protein n=1 Tax=Brassicogethes aeneus TaxID=1431903 RepID=A0A9P0ATP8_BRAAE|nr:unnamed protein product [Brassicogethes aeneus]
MVNKARKLKKDYGILAEPEKLKGKSISNKVSEKVRQFYEDDEFSRMCPGKKEFVSVRDSKTGKRIHMQKLLLFVNLKELNLTFQERYPQLKIGLSKFSSLRPPWCVTVTACGVHSVCVCETHQNLKLLTAALSKKIECKNILSTIVCSVDSRNCMLYRCENCPGSEALEQLMLDIFSENDLETDDNIAYKQWVHKGQSKLVNMTSTIEDFVKDLSKAADQATTHHFTAKSQASYLRNLKENIPAETEVIVLLDLAENHSFVCQDAIQGFHWDTTQAALHPFVIYFRSKKQTDLKCFMTVQVHNIKTLLIYAYIKKILTSVLNGTSLPLHMEKVHVMELAARLWAQSKVKINDLSVNSKTGIPTFNGLNFNNGRFRDKISLDEKGLGKFIEQKLDVLLLAAVTAEEKAKI